MRVLLVTSSARGHAIAEALARSPQKPDIFSLCTTRNPGIRRIAVAQEVIDIMNFPAVCAHAKRWQPDFAIIGPDDPIGAGLADVLEEIGVPTVAPKKSFARIESSKGFARELLRKYGIEASPKFRIFSSHPLSLTLPPRERGMPYHPLPLGGRVRERGSKKEMHRFIHDELQGNYVVKYDGLRGGKGVKVSGEHLASVEEGVDYACQCIAQCGRVVIEEKLEGVEFSLMSFVSGTSVVHMPVVQDHKRAYEGDLGPNTGGMGSYSMPDHSLPFLTHAELARAREINQLVAEALHREYNLPNRPLPRPLPHCGGGGGYVGVLYGGYMATRSASSHSTSSGTSSGPSAANSIRVIEFNARFGDPEALNVLPILESDFVVICQAILSGELSEDLVRFARKATVCKYIVPEGYPEKKEQNGQEVQLPPLPLRCNPLSRSLPSKGERISAARIYYGDITEDPNGTLRLGASRALGVVGIGDTFGEAEHIAQAFCEQVRGPVRFRADIGTAALLQKRVAMIRELRSLAVCSQNKNPSPSGRG